MMPAPISGDVSEVDLQQAERFLTLLAEGEPVTFQTFTDRDGAAQAYIRHGTIEQHAAFLARLNQQRVGVYVMVNAGDGKGRKRENVVGVRALFLDLDGAPLEPVQACPLTPHVIVESSPGKWHVYWMVSGCELADFEGYQKALAARFGGDPKVCDLPRVMRVPGFLHWKAEPFRTRIVELHELQPYPIAEIVAPLELKKNTFTKPPEPRQNSDRQPAATSAPAIIEGGRNDALAKLAGRLRRDGLSSAAIEAALAEVNRERCRPPLTAAEVRQIARSIGKYPGGEMPRPGEWADPILPSGERVPPIDFDVLPSWVSAMARAVSEATQTPPPMAVMMALSVLAAVLQRRFEVSPYGDEYTEPLSLWCLIVLASGSRKTAVIKPLVDVLVDWEKLERDRMRPEIARVLAQRDVISKRIETLKLQAGKADEPKERQRLQDEIQRERESMPNELFAPRLFSGDTTSERLQQMLVEQDERIAIVSDEGGIFQIMAGAYSGGLASLDVYLQGHAGAAMRVDRAGRLAHIDRPALSFGLALQPGILQKTGKTQRFRDSGLMARFLYAVPKSNVGTRDVRARAPIPEAVRAAWESNIFSLLKDIRRPIGKPALLAFDAQAREMHFDFADEIEQQQGDGGRYAHMADWTSKLPGAAARIAALLALAEHGVEIRTVDATNVRRAVTLAQALLGHAEAAFRLLGAGDAENDALHVLAFLKRTKVQAVARRDLQKGMEGRFRSLEKLLAAIRCLQDWHILGPELKTEGAGRPSIYYEVNPKTFVDPSLKSHRSE
jgi:replicative DNA helicase